MVDALVEHGCATEAWKFTKRLKSRDATHSFMNTVIYGTLFKGFVKEAAHPGNVTACYTEMQMMSLYEEMRSCGCQANTITYNTMFSAFAFSKSMHRIPALLHDMKSAAPPVELDLISYATLILGFCRAGDVDGALRMLKDMLIEGIIPTMAIYNTLLDASTQEDHLDDAAMAIADMRRNSVMPACYLLSRLVKVVGRSKRLREAFDIIDGLSREFGVKVNINVYTCCIRSCFRNRKPSKAKAAHDRLIKEGPAPSPDTYSAAP
jgi:pentatricopeptide repeat protein